MARRCADPGFGKQVKAERERLKWTQAEMAKLLSDNGFHLGSTDVAKIEAGTRVVRIDEALAISDMLGVPLENLLGRATGLRNEQLYRLRILRISADRLAHQVAGVARDLSDRCTDVKDIEFDGREALHADAWRAWNALRDADQALVSISHLKLPEEGSQP